jgi:hypothetical protein
MGIKCSRCDTENPSDSKHSKECVTTLFSFEGVPCTYTLTIDMSIDEITASETLTRRFQIIQEWGKKRTEWTKHKI